uniref:Putative BTSP secretory protein n=1 Tax=Argas monolakensis TaxID=34602 RepID=Q09JT8_ARGMO|nr:putative BTSP secretory protein [Argas monolakensis]
MAAAAAILCILYSVLHASFAEEIPSPTKLYNCGEVQFSPNLTYDHCKFVCLKTAHLKDKVAQWQEDMSLIDGYMCWLNKESQEIGKCLNGKCVSNDTTTTPPPPTTPGPEDLGC